MSTAGPSPRYDAIVALQYILFDPKKNETRLMVIDFSRQHLQTALVNDLHVLKFDSLPYDPRIVVGMISGHFKSSRVYGHQARLCYAFLKKLCDRFSCQLKASAINNIDSVSRMGLRDQLTPEELLCHYEQLFVQQQKPSSAIHHKQHILDIVADLPNGPGVYIFKDQQGVPVYIGKSIHLRDRVRSHFSADLSMEKEYKIKSHTHDIEIIETAGEYSALFLEAQLVKRYKPLYNRKLRRDKGYYALRIVPEGDRYIMHATYDFDVSQFDHYYGIFKNWRQATSYYRKALKENNLCEYFAGIVSEPPCFTCQTNQRAKNCGKVSKQEHENFQYMIDKLRLKSWDYPEIILLKETSADGAREQYIALSHWCFLGLYDSIEAVDVDQFSAKKFDADYFFLAQKAMKSLSLVFLQTDLLLT